jgi:hypothetical protein
LLTSLSAPILISFAKDWNFFIFNCRERFAITTKCTTRPRQRGRLAKHYRFAAGFQAGHLFTSLGAPSCNLGLLDWAAWAATSHGD